ncbi:MAG: hypothetical protein ACT4PI_09070 [Actinomycetota bacterium]
MKDGTCPKCSSTDVRVTTVINTELLTSAYEFDTYFCRACGYFEHYAADLAKLAEAATTWPSVSR